MAGDYPEWLDAPLAAAFGENRVAELQALAARAPVDLRVNTLKVGRDKALAALAHLGAELSPPSPMGLRIALAEDARAPAVQAEPAFQKGWIEIQDEGSQLAALLAAADPGQQVIDLCAGARRQDAGAGGADGQSRPGLRHRRRQAPPRAHLRAADACGRAERAGAARQRARTTSRLKELRGRADLVVVDAPCTGAGTWRRNPDAKWRVRPTSLEVRMAEQAEVLDRAAALVKPGGRIAYITCSLLPAENDEAVKGFLAASPASSRSRPRR